MPDETRDAVASEPETRTPDPASSDPSAGAGAPDAPAPGSPAEEATPDGSPSSASSRMPEYKGEPLDAERGPGLGCFWIQIALLTFFLIFTPLTVTWGWDPLISGALLIFTLILLLFSGQTIIFLLRLVAADRRTRRAPLNPSAKPTVGQMEDAASAMPATDRESAASDVAPGPTAGAEAGAEPTAGAEPGAGATADMDGPPAEEKHADG